MTTLIRTVESYILFILSILFPHFIVITIFKTQNFIYFTQKEYIIYIFSQLRKVNSPQLSCVKIRNKACNSVSSNFRVKEIPVHVVVLTASIVLAKRGGGVKEFVTDPGKHLIYYFWSKKLEKWKSRKGK